MGVTPFLERQELYSKLYIDADGDLRNHKEDTKSPDDRHHDSLTLPGHPALSLQDPNIGPFLKHELVPTRLNKFGQYLWLLATQDSGHISPLTHQLVKGRRIVLTENPDLHLVWIYDQVFLKPIPKYLLSSAFWHFYLEAKTSPIHDQRDRADIASAALGFLRSYSYLVQHKSDFQLATDPKHTLLPKNTRYAPFIRFIASCRGCTSDRDVCPRYRFGELRLSRLNFWSKFFLRRLSFLNVHGQYGARFAQYYAPILFVFGSLSVALNAMQAAVVARPLLQDTTGAEHIMAAVSWGFSVCALFIAAVLIGGVLAFFLLLVCREMLFAVRDLVRKRRSQVVRPRPRPV